MVSSAVIAIESTILATAVNSIVSDIGGFAQFPWLFSVYLLAQAVTVPIYAKLADTYGRKRIILVGIGAFLLGSVLCGFAWNMTALIIFRAIQGLGAGAVQPMTMTIAGDIYSVAERARVQGYLASVWAISAVLGPALGGVFSQFLSWRFIFFVNIPVCIVAAWLIIRSFHEAVESRRHKVDYLGVILLTVSVTLVLLAVLEGGHAWAWNSWQVVGSLVFGAVLLVAFVIVESRAAEAIIPTWVMKRPLLVTTNVVGLGTGVIVLGVTSFVPLYLEGSLDVAPLLAGAGLTVLTIGWPLAASVSGRIYMRIGFKATMLIGIGIVIAGTAAVAGTSQQPAVWIVISSCFVIGFGMGLTVTPAVVAAQASVEWNERGVVTGVNVFARTLGSSLGVAALGTLINLVLAGYPNGEHDPVAVKAAGAAVFTALTCIAAATVVAVLAMPRTPVHTPTEVPAAEVH